MKFMFKCAVPNEKLAKLKNEDIEKFSFLSAIEKEGFNSSSSKRDVASN